MDSRRRAIMGIAKSGGGLPNEYQEVEYLQSTGEQYIDTGVYDNNNDNEIKMSFAITTTTQTQYAELFGDALSASNKGFAVLWERTSLNYYYNGYVPLGNITPTINTKYLIEERFGSYGLEIKLDNNIIATSTTSFVADTSRTIMLLGNPSNRIKAKVYFCQIYDNSVLVRNFIPCYRKADNKPGMYDLVSGVFYTNANTSASQDFIVGPDV